MIEIVVYEYLKDVLDVPVYLEIPKTPAEKYVVIEKTGSGITNHIRRATFTIQSIAPTMYEAAYLNEQVKDAMDGAISLADISRSHMESDYNFTDQSKKNYRYQAVYELIHY